MHRVVMDRVGADQRRMIGMREHRVGERGIAVGDLEPDAVALRNTYDTGSTSMSNS